MIRRFHQRQPARRAPVLLAVIAATLAGCLEPSAPSVGPTPTANPEPTPVTTTYEPRATVWYEGLVLHIDRVVSTLDSRGGLVEVAVRIQNPNDEAGELDGPIRLVVGDAAVAATRDSAIPGIAAQGSASLVLTYELQGIPSVDGAVVEVGEAPLHVARVPLGSAAGPPVTFEPVALEVAGSATSRAMKVTLRSGLVRWDLPDWSQELDASFAVLILTYDVTYAGDFGGGLAFTGENVALRLPDGTIVDPRRDGHSQSVELIGARKTRKGLFSRFEIPSGLNGEFALLVRNSGTEKSIVFTIQD